MGEVCDGNRVENWLREIMDDSKCIEIDYTNWRGERAWRVVQPISLAFTSNEWHQQEQWLMKAWDFERQAWRDYALAGIHGIRTTTEGKDNE